MKYDEENKGYFLDSGDYIQTMYGDEDSIIIEDYFYRNDREFTPEERKEISEYMIELWKKWAK